MYATDVIWWSYTAYALAVVVFMLWFTRKVTQPPREEKEVEHGKE